MKTAIVTFVQYHTYEVEISDEIYNNADDWEAIKIAEKDFETDMRSPIANTTWDDVEVEFENDEYDVEVEYLDEEDEINEKI